jgi:RNA polymerase sigma-70 factor (ECF subfamily)
MTGLATEPAVLDFDDYRRELTGYCYRMLGSAFDAEDAVQETMVRAWRGRDGFEGRAAVRSWLYRIATNVSLDMLKGRQRRAMPMDLSPTAWQPVEASLADPLPSQSWVEPVPDSWCLAETSDPAEAAVARESIRLAFVAALQLLPPRQRAVLILRDVLRWKADEVATLLDTSVASVNSALQRARATLAERGLEADTRAEPMTEEHAALLTRYVDAFERYDIDAFVALLHEDATQSMPPFRMWLQGPADIGSWMVGVGSACRGSQMLPVMANGSPALAQYKPSKVPGRLEPWAIHVLTVSGDRISGITNFLETGLFSRFGLPAYLEA